MKKSTQKKIEAAIHLEFCKALNLSPQRVTDAMNAAPCFLGSEKHFENTVKAVVKALKKDKSV